MKIWTTMFDDLTGFNEFSDEGQMGNDQFSIKDLSIKFERRLKRISELGILGLKKVQVYPPQFLKSADSILPDARPLIDKSTPVGSMGSCFAREIKNHLERMGFNYISRGGGQHGSAPWERVYNTACIKQEIQRAFGQFDGGYLKSADQRIIDPYRKKTNFQSLHDAQKENAVYIQQAKSALMDASVFIFTLGLSEIWYDKKTGFVFAEIPPAEVFDRNSHACRILEPQENYQNLHDAFELLREKNKAIHIIVTVSPVPLRATFFNRSAIVSNNISKSSLIFAAHKITQTLPYVSYFPSYEITFHLSNDPFEWDYRHVKPETVAMIMDGFERTYCCEKAK